MNIEKWIEQALSKIGTMKIYKLEMFKFAKAKSVLGGGGWCALFLLHVLRTSVRNTLGREINVTSFSIISY